MSGFRASFESEIDARVFEVLLRVCLRWTQLFLKRWSGSIHPGIRYLMPSSPGRFLGFDSIVLIPLYCTLAAQPLF